MESKITKLNICTICCGVTYHPDSKEFIDNHWNCGVKDYPKIIKISKYGVKISYEDSSGPADCASDVLYQGDAQAGDKNTGYSETPAKIYPEEQSRND